MTRRSADASKLSAYRIGDKAPHGAIRLGAVRHLPRGVKREDRGEYFDVWLPLLAPSRELLRWWLDGEISDTRFKTFARRYEREMAGSDTQGAIGLVAAMAKQIPVALGCYCDRKQCHRFLLEAMIRAQARRRTGRRARRSPQSQK
jgi:uncharacterized protein YeaO (DUF488 family)